MEISIHDWGSGKSVPVPCAPSFKLAPACVHSKYNPERTTRPKSKTLEACVLLWRQVMLYTCPTPTALDV